MVTYGQVVLAFKAIETAYRLVKKYQQENPNRKSRKRKGDPRKKYGGSR